jgi:hypothetical protein
MSYRCFISFLKLQSCYQNKNHTLYTTRSSSKWQSSSRSSRRWRASGGVADRTVRWGRAWPRACRAGWRRRGPGGGGWRGARARRRARARTAGPATTCWCKAAGGAAATPGRQGDLRSPGRWPPASPPAAPASARPLRGLRVKGIIAGRVRRARWGVEQRGRMSGRGAEPYTVNAYTAVLSSSRDIV